MKLTIGIVTNRRGGLGVVFDSLKSQTCKDFEVVLVDGMFPERCKIVDKMLFDFHLTHVPEERWKDKKYSLYTNVNTAFLHADGELFASFGDYTFFHPSFVDRVNRASITEGQALFYRIDHAQPPLRGFVDELVRTYKRLEWDMLDIEMDKRFRKIAASEYFDMPDVLLEVPWNETINNAVVHRNDFKAVGGCDEEYDDGYSHGDTDLYRRLSMKGVKFVVDPHAAVAHIDHPWYPIPSDDGNPQYYKKKFESGGKVNNGSLRERPWSDC